MLVEKIIFTILALYLIIVIFFKFIKKIDKIYIPVLVIELIGLILEIIEIIFDLKFNIVVKILMYLISVVIPLIIIIMENKGLKFSEYVYLLLAKFYNITRK